ncbi:MAG: hypothetical protein H0T73_03420 [Ardenticatenales bacterium]|nr:hypothetical protein [Ardenticatenales bacterium]
MSFSTSRLWFLVSCLLLGACNAAPPPSQPETTATPALAATSVAATTPTVDAPTVPLSPTPLNTPVVMLQPSPVTSCAVAIHEPFREMWQQAGVSAENCPAADASTRAGAQELFERGRMFWVAGPEGSAEGTIYVLLEAGEWELYPDTWTEGQVDRTGLTPPEGMVEPQRGFGKVWREELGGVESPLGWATEFEQGGEVTVQPLLDGSYLLSFDGVIYHLPQGQSWSAK